MKKHYYQDHNIEPQDQEETTSYLHGTPLKIRQHSSQTAMTASP